MFYSFYRASKSSRCIIFLSDIVLSLRSFNSLLTPMRKVLYDLVFVPKVNTTVRTSAFACLSQYACGEQNYDHYILIGVYNIFKKILSLHLLYVYYVMLCILVYQFELHGIMRIMYQHLK